MCQFKLSGPENRQVGTLNELLSARRSEALRKEIEKPADERRDAATVVNETMEGWLFRTPESVTSSEKGKRDAHMERSRGAEHRSIRVTFGRSSTAYWPMPGFAVFGSMIFDIASRPCCSRMAKV